MSCLFADANSLLCTEYEHLNRHLRTDCVTTEWSTWSNCAVGCGGAPLRNRTRSTTSPPTVGGVPCPEPAALVEYVTCDPNDKCPDDPSKMEPGVCGCGVVDDDTDTDSDGTPDCVDACPDDAAKAAAGVCGCGVEDNLADTDSDGTPDCADECPTDASKSAAGACGCNVADVDTDGDGTVDCLDACPSDSAKVVNGTCGCGVADTDSDGDGVPDCQEVDMGTHFEDAVTGRLKDNVSPSPNIGYSSTASAADECATRCIEQGLDCLSFSFSQSLQRCYIHNNVVGDDGLVNYCDYAGYETTSSCVSYQYFVRRVPSPCTVSDWNDWLPCEGNVCGVGIRSRQRSVLSEARYDRVSLAHSPCCSPCTCASASALCVFVFVCVVVVHCSSYGGDSCPVLSEIGECNQTTAWDSTPESSPADPLDWFATPAPGSLYESSTRIVRLIDVASAAGCGKECLERTGCAAFDYSASGRYCELRNKADGDNGASNYCTRDGGSSASSVGCTTYEHYIRVTAVDCALTEWSAWSNCTAQCDGHARSRSRSVVTFASYGGSPCPPDVFMTEFETCDPNDKCLDDPLKMEPGVCGCGIVDVDSDGDTYLDCLDDCPDDASLHTAGVCGCVVGDETDADGDGVPACLDACPSDSNKTAAGVCGCGELDTDSDKDGVLDCVDGCPLNINKTAPGICGCTITDIDADSDGTMDCLESDVLTLFADAVNGRLKDNVSPNPNIGSYTSGTVEECGQRCIDEGTSCESFSWSSSQCCTCCRRAWRVELISRQTR